MVEFRDWQRLAPLAILVLLLRTWFFILRHGFYALFAGGAWLYYSESLRFLPWLLLILAVLALLSLAGALLYHWRFRFRLEEDAIRVRRGLLHIEDLRIRLGRIQSVNISQPFYFMPLGLVRLSLETPGSSEAEVQLLGIRKDVAHALRAAIAPGREDLEASGAPVTPALSGSGPEEISGLLFAPSRLRIMAYGLVSNRIWLILGALIGMLFSLGLGEKLLDKMIANGLSMDLMRYSLLWIGLMLVFLGVLFLLSGLLALLMFYGYRLRDGGGQLEVVSGLLERREQVVRLPKLTGVTVEQTLLGRLTGMFHLFGRQTRSSDAQAQTPVQRFLVPGLRESDLNLVEALLPGLQPPDGLVGISPRYRWILWMRLGPLLLLGSGLLWWMLPAERWISAAGLAFSLLILLSIHLSWRGWAWQLKDGFCWIRSGRLGRRHEAFRLDQVQQASIRTSPYLRRHGLATVQFVLPHGSVRLPFIAREEADELLDLAIWAAESAATHRV